MLVPIQLKGTKPPLFFVHGLYGTMPLGRVFARVLGADQPIYVIHANGIDGKQAPIDDVGEMVAAYIEEIEGVRPAGPIRIGGMCNGCLAAMEIARRLQPRQAGPVILADPPPVILSQVKQNHMVDHRRPQVAAQLYRQARGMLLGHASQAHNDMPFDFRDPKQMHIATLAAVATLAAFARYVPSPFPGPVELIVSAQHAPGFFHPQMTWHNLLPGPRMVHVLPWDHQELFRAGREEVARLLKFMLERAPSDATAEADEQRSFA